MMSELTITFLEDECWYGPQVADGAKMPLTPQSEYRCNIDPNTSVNQAVPLLLSNKGRYVWSEQGFTVEVKNGVINITSAKAEIELFTGDQTLRSAYLAACQKHFPPSGKAPPQAFFMAPQFNTWIELVYNQNQQDIIRYAEAILKNGYAPGVLMIDDNWMRDYGDWQFRAETFPNPREMIDRLHDLGFKVMLWTCPFVSPDSMVYRKLAQENLLVRDSERRIAVREWWNGFSAVLDLSNPKAVAWYHAQNKRIQDEVGIDGFKFDAGDARFYRDDDVTFAPVSANDQSELWAKVGLAYPYNEYRACFKMGNRALVQRLADKNHSWDENGVAGLVPNQLMQGLLGYAFTCPDMIGGGEFANFTENANTLDEELFVRYAQCAALAPMMQFSASPWRVLSDENARLCLQASKLRETFQDVIHDLAQQAACTGEPMMRYMEYVFPSQGLACVIDQFMLGDNVLVAPVLQKGRTTRKVCLPLVAGSAWYSLEGQRYTGGEVIMASAPLYAIPIFVLKEEEA